MTACLALGAAVMHLATGAFTLQWTHSVERVTWQEDWQVTPRGLTLVQSRIRGSGAGMEPGPDAVLSAGWWVSPGHLEVPRLTLAASGATGAGWTICADGACRTLGTAAGPPISLEPCDTASVNAPGPVAD